MSIDRERIDKLLKVTQQGLGHQGLVYNVRSLAGELSWVAGIIPAIRPFVNMVWAATYAMDKQPEQGASKTTPRRRPQDAVFAKMVRLPFKWLRLFLQGHVGGLTRRRLLWDRYASTQWGHPDRRFNHRIGRHFVRCQWTPDQVVGLPPTRPRPPALEHRARSPRAHDGLRTPGFALFGYHLGGPRSELSIRHHRPT